MTDVMIELHGGALDGMFVVVNKYDKPVRLLMPIPPPSFLPLEPSLSPPPIPIRIYQLEEDQSHYEFIGYGYA